MKQNAENKPRQEDTRFGKCQGETPMWGKPFDRIFLSLHQTFSRKRVQKLDWLAQFKVKTTLEIFAINCSQTSALTRKVNSGQSNNRMSSKQLGLPCQTRPNQEVKLNPKQWQWTVKLGQTVVWNLRSASNFGLRSKCSKCLDFRAKRCGLLRQITPKNWSQMMPGRSQSKLVNTGQTVEFLWFSTLQFYPEISSSFCHKRERENAPWFTNQWGKERECVRDEDAKWGGRALVFIQVNEGEESCLLGFMGLHDDVADQNKLYMSGHKFKIILLHVQMRWSLYQSWSSRKEESNAIIISIKRAIPRWNFVKFWYVLC